LGLALTHGVTAWAQSATPSWTESLGLPTVYVDHARAKVAHGRYLSAARDLRRAAAMLATRSQRVFGLDRLRLVADCRALRLTARDVAAGAVTNAAQFHGVLDATHTAVSEHTAAAP